MDSQKITRNRSVTCASTETDSMGVNGYILNSANSMSCTNVSATRIARTDIADTPTHGTVCHLNGKPKHCASTNADYIEIDGSTLKLNTHGGKYAVRTDITWSAYQQMKWMMARYRRLCQIRLETPTFYSEDECEKFTKQFKYLLSDLKKHYSTKHIGYLWVRENSRQRGWHFHIVLWIDGKQCQSSYVATKLWNERLWRAQLLTKLTSDNKLNELREIKSKKFFSDDQDAVSEAVHAWTYLAKPRTKGLGRVNTRDFSVSQLHAKR